MTIKLDRPTEAFAAVAWIVCTADGVGSREEQRFLYEHLHRLEVFEHCEPVEFQMLLGTTFNRVFGAFPGGELSITEERAENLIQAVKEVLSPELRVEAFKVAVGLARAERSCDEKDSRVGQLRSGLEIDDSVAQHILGR